MAVASNITVGAFTVFRVRSVFGLRELSELSPP